MGILAGGGRGGGGAGAIPVDVLPNVEHVANNQLYLRLTDHTLWTRDELFVPAMAATDASWTDAAFTSADLVARLDNWYGTGTQHPYPAVDSGAYYNRNTQLWYEKAAGTLAGAITTGTPSYDSAYNYRGVHAAQPTGTHADDDIYFNSTNGQWYIYSGSTYTVVADVPSLFDETNPVWIGPPDDTIAEVQERIYRLGYRTNRTYIFYDSVNGAIVDVGTYAVPQNDWTETHGAFVIDTTTINTNVYPSEAAMVAALEANYSPSDTWYGYLDTAFANALITVTDFVNAMPFRAEHYRPFWQPVSEDLVRGPGVSTFADAAARDAALTGAALMPYENNDHLLISVGTTVQRYANSAWQDVSGWIAGARGPVGPAPAAPVVRGQRVAGYTFVAGDYTPGSADNLGTWTLDPNAPAGFSVDDFIIYTDIVLTPPVGRLSDNQIGYEFVITDGSDEAVILKPIRDTSNVTVTLGGVDYQLSFGGGGYFLGINNAPITLANDVTVECFVAKV